MLHCTILLHLGLVYASLKFYNGQWRRSYLVSKNKKANCYSANKSNGYEPDRTACKNLSCFLSKHFWHPNSHVSKTNVSHPHSLQSPNRPRKRSMLSRSLTTKRAATDTERAPVEDRKCTGSLFSFSLFWIFSTTVGIIIFDANALFITLSPDKHLKND